MRYALLLFSLTLCAQNARIEGRILDDEGKPIARATVMVGRLTDAQPATVLSDEEGRFVLEKLTPGSGYALAVQKTGYVRTAYGASGLQQAPPQFDLEPGENLSGLVIRLMGQGVITGRVTDQAGDPVVRAQVMVQQARYRLGTKTMVTAQAAQTDDQGNYRIAGLPQGRYVLIATDAANSNVAPSAGTIAPRGNQATYFRGTVDLKNATTVDVASGSEFKADIQLLRAPLFTIRGQMLDEGGAPLPIRGVTARRADGLQNFLRGLKMTAADGTFALTGLSPGEYIVESAATFNSTTGEPIPALIGSTRAIIGTSDVTVVLRTSPGANVKGALSVEDGAWKLAAAPPGRFPATVSEAMLTGSFLFGLQPFAAITVPDAPLGLPRPAQIQADGSFEIVGVNSAEYQLTIGGLPEDYYLKSVNMGDSDVTHARLSLPGGNLKVVLSPKGAAVSGNMASEGLAIFLWPVTPDPSRALSGIRSMNSGKKGLFRFTGLPPGEYRIAAFDAPDPGVLWNYEFLSQFADAAPLLKISEDLRITAEPTLIPPARFKEAFDKLL